MLSVMDVLSVLLLLYVVGAVAGSGSGRLRFSRMEHEPRVYAAAPSGLLVARVRAFDVDDPNVMPFYRLLGDSVPASDAQYFQIHAESGNLTTKRYIDRPTGSVYNVMVAAYNNGDTEYTELAIKVTEYNKYPPNFRSQNYKVDVELIAPVGTEIIKVQALDNDPQHYNSEVYYYSQSRVVGINRTTGVISLRENLHPRDRTLNVNLLAFDGGSPRRSARSKLTINVKIISAPRDLSVEQTGDQWAMLCWSPPPSGSPLGYVIYLTSTTDFMSDRAPSVSTQRNITREELGSRGGRDCTALADLESWSDFEARIAGWDVNELGMISRAISFDTKVNNCPDNACNQGECIVTRDPTIMYRCKCEPGYFGLRCNLYDPCYFTPCLNNGTCYNLNNSQFKCSCLAGFYGEDCSNFNPCSSTVSPCQHGGTCTSSGSNQYVCDCPAGYQGQSCEIFNPCLQTACKNGGICENKSSTEFGCTCPPGYTGNICEVEIDECESSPCLNQGRCVDEIAAFRCICISGFDGDLCETNVDDCLSSPCLHGGTCVDLVDGHSCTCISGRTGPVCEFEVKECASTPCKNNGTCVEDTPGYTCVCSAGFEGDSCEVEINECSSYPCLNGGTCIDGVNDFRCTCLPGFTGRRCDINIDLCSDYPCQNGGTCIQFITEKEAYFSCHCAAGFSGHSCHQKERCPPEIQPTKKGTFMWPELEFNTTFQLECPYGSSSNASRETEAAQRIGKKTINKENPERHRDDGRVQHRLSRNGKPFAERTCILLNGSAVWAPIRDQNCREEGYSNAELMTERLHALTKSPSLINGSVFLEVASQLRQILSYAINDRKIARSMVHIVSSILEMESSVMDRADVNGSVAYSLVETLNSYTAHAHLPPSGPGLALVSPNIALHIRLVEKNFASSKPGVIFAPMQVSEDVAASQLTSSRKQQVNIEVPQEAIRGVPSTEKVRVQFVYYRNSKLFKDRRRWRLDRDSPVLSASLANTTVANLSSPVRYSLPTSGFPRGHTCVYWDTYGMQWTTTGVRTNVTNGWVVCEADHLTAFSVLLDPHPGRYLPHDHEAVLTAISYFGALLSITGLLLTVLTYSLFRCLNRDRSGKILLNLCISLLFMNISFLVISIKEHIGVYQQDLCMVVAMLVHYFVLSSLCWMLVEAVNMYQLLITVFASSETRFILKRMLFAWGVPMCVVGGTVYYTGFHYYRFRDPEWCLFSPSSTAVYYLTFVGPATFILFVNTVVFLMVTRVLCQRRNISKNGHKNEDGVTAAQVRGAFTVMTLLGVTWIFGVFAVGELRLFFQYVFSVANSLQGFIIFLVRCVQYPEARRAWGRFLRTGELKSYRGGKGRSTSTRHTSSGSQSRNTGTVKGDIAWGGVRSRNQQERMRELRTEIVRPRNKNSVSASFTLPRPSAAPQPMHGSMSRSRSLHLEDNSSKEGDDTSWRFIAPSAPPAPTDQGYGTAEHSPESPRQQPRRQTAAPHLSVSTPERLHSSPCHPSAGPSAHSESDMVVPPELYPPRRESDATTTEPTSTVTSPSPTPSPSTTPTGSPSPVHVWTHIPPHKPPKRLHCEELL